MTNPNTNIIKKIFNFLLDLVEVYIPSICFLGIFVTFIIQILFRYVFRSPLTWTFDATMVLYTHALMLGACYTLREHDHIYFSLIYDAVSERKQRILRILCSLIIVVVFSASLYSCIDYAWFIKSALIKKTSVLYIPYRYIYIAMIVMMVDSIVRYGIDLYKDLKELFCPAKEDNA